ncbi:hypothetical protein AVEN_62671-1 [Araneus ventricosus]|uniref:Uncharacterized protein n=1 Tax=Araneus ventricosus TaxID=182803 RepID=A0A4Y2KYZ3_ARAVE|nr:hypothetical protein AVEN_62671-1 [Araneus ventricosus]
MSNFLESGVESDGSDSSGEFSLSGESETMKSCSFENEVPVDIFEKPLKSSAEITFFEKRWRLEFEFLNGFSSTMAKCSVRIQRLLSMLTDNRENIRSLALRKLICARNESRGSSEVRIFQVPKIDFKATDHFALFNWKRVGCSEPPLLMNVPFKEIVAMVKVRKKEEWSKYPCHTEAVERCIRLMSEASESVYGEEKRHGFILNRKQSRSLIKQYNTKKDYNL